MSADSESPAPVIVIDIGSSSIRAGLAGEDSPSAVVPAVIGLAKVEHAMDGPESKAVYVGQEAIAKRAKLLIKHPIDHGIVLDWENFMELLCYTFEEELRIDPAGKVVLVTEPPHAIRSQRERMLEVLFHNFDVAGVSIQSSSVLGLYATGRLTGLAVDVGETVTYTAPVWEGLVDREAVHRLDVAGRDITTALERLLRSEGIPMTSSERSIVNDIKEKLCYCAKSVEEERHRAQEEISEEYELPDGAVINVGQSRFEAPEALFSPAQILEVSSNGIQNDIAAAISASDPKRQQTLAKNIVLMGGTSYLTRFADRLVDELSTLLHVKPEVCATPERKYLSWIGGSMVGVASGFSSTVFSQVEYEEEGAAGIVRVMQKPLGRYESVKLRPLGK